MAEDLGIRISCELEADVSASAKRIAAQLPSIADAINKQSKVKVQVELDSDKVTSQAKTVAQQVQQVMKTQEVGVNVSLSSDSVAKLKSELENLNVSSSATDAIVASLDNMGVQIDKISGKWVQAGENEERMLSLSIQGTDQLSRTVSLMTTYAAEADAVSTTVTNVTTNLKEQRAEQEKLAAQEKANNEARLQAVSKYQAELAKIEASYTGKTSTKPVTNETSLDALSKQYELVESAINEVASANGKMTTTMQTQVESAIAKLKLMATEYQNIEYSATKLQAKNVTQVNAEYTNELEQYKNDLEASGILTESFEKKIAELKTQLSTAFDRQSLTAFNDSFSLLKQDVVAFQTDIKNLNSIYTEMISVQKEITSYQTEMLNTDITSSEYTALQEEVELRYQQLELLDQQREKYSEVETYASGATKYYEAQLEAAAQVNTEMAKQVDTVAQIDSSMSTWLTKISNIEKQMTQLNNPTEELKSKVSELRTLYEDVGNANSEQEKITAYNKLKQAVSECSTEIQALNKSGNLDLKADKLSSQIQKANADLETLERTWSAFKSNGDLTAQFNELKTSLNGIDSPTKMSAWNAQLATFKSEVRAAGKNCQSFADTLKDSLSKVTQWLSATTLVFQAINSIKSAVSTIVELDSAMIDLRKTTDATEAEYEEFYNTANETAKALGATTEEVISATAEWSRLGYTLEEAAELAENSAIFSSISEDLDLEEATDGLVSIIKAYGIEVDDTMDGIISKINSVGNAFAVTNSDIVDVLTRSASAMSAANNTFEETVALATAATEITRDASSVGERIAQCRSNAA